MDEINEMRPGGIPEPPEEGAITRLLLQSMRVTTPPASLSSSFVLHGGGNIAEIA